MSNLIISSRFRTLLNSFLAVGVFFILGTASAFADNTYTVSETSGIGALPNVGAATVVLGTNVTLTDVGGGDFADPESISFAINSPSYPNVVFDTSVTTVTITGTVGVTSTPATVTYNAGRTTATFTASGGGASANGETIIIAGLKVGTLYATSAPGAAALFQVDNATSSIGSAVSGPNHNFAVTEGTLTSTGVTPDSFANSNLTTHTIAFTMSGVTGSSALPTGGKIVVTYPTGFDLSAVNGTTAQSLSGLDGTWTAVVSGQTVTLTQTNGSATAAGAKSLQLTNVRNPAETGTTGTFTINTQIAAGNSVQIATSAAIVIGASSSTDAATLGDIKNISIKDTDGGVMLTWDDPTGSSDDTTFVQILRGVDPVPVSGSVYASVAIGKEYYVDTDVKKGQKVSYMLRGTDGTSTGDLSDVVTFTVGSSATVDTEEDTTTDTEDTTTTTDTEEDTTTDTETDTTASDTEESSSFTDISGHWAQTAVEAMSAAGVITGYEDGTFKPNGNLNRAEAAALLWRVLGAGEPSAATANPFKDVDTAQWYASYVASLKDLELVAGNPDGTYQPAEEINRAEFLQLAMNVYNYLNPDSAGASDMDYEAVLEAAYGDIDTSAWYAGMVAVATSHGYVQGSSCDEGTCFNAGNSITRAEATKILYNMFKDML